ncbi:MAG: aldo/keto reductase [Eubacteriales bacterium]|nr:aldo/keto reductase [Eubacteriales bacterium]
MSKLGFGFMRLPVTDPNDATSVNIELLTKMVDLYLARGNNYFDTAYRYCDFASEPALKETLTSRYPRDSYELTDKITLGFIKSEEEQQPYILNQLERCGVDYFDNYLIHNMNAAFYEKAKQFHTFEFLQRIKQEGLCIKTGISFHGTPDLLEEILQHYPAIDLVQLQLNYCDWEDAGIQSRRCYEICVKHQKTVLVMEPIKGGNLANLPQEAAALFRAKHPDWSQASWAIRFAASLPHVYRVLSGMSTLEQAEDNTGYMQDFSPLTDEETELCMQAAAIIKSNTAIPCTGCRYCEGDCPKNIAISNYFALFNEEKRASVNYVHAAGFYYKALTQTRGKASDCIACGLCEKNCPQRLTIREHLKNVAATFEK